MATNSANLKISQEVRKKLIINVKNNSLCNQLYMYCHLTYSVAIFMFMYRYLRSLTNTLL